MEVKPEQAVKSVIAYKSERRKQLASEKKQLSKSTVSQKSFDAEMLKKISKLNGVDVTKKKLSAIKEKSEKEFGKWRDDFRKFKRPSPNKKESMLSVLAHHHNHPGGGSGRPAPKEPPQDQDITQAICFNSAIRCEGDLCERATSEIFPKVKSKGAGGTLGNGAAEPTILSNSLYFLFCSDRQWNC